MIIVEVERVEIVGADDSLAGKIIFLLSNTYSVVVPKSGIRFLEGVGDLKLIFNPEVSDGKSDDHLRMKRVTVEGRLSDLRKFANKIGLVTIEEEAEED